MPISVSQWKKAGSSEIYSQPIAEAVTNGINDLICQMNAAGGNVFSSARTGQIIIENTSYSFSLVMNLVLNDFVPLTGQNNFTYSTMRLTYLFHYDHCTQTCRVKGVRAKDGVYQGTLNGGSGTGNTRENAEELLKNSFINQLSEQVKSEAQELLWIQIKPITVFIASKANKKEAYANREDLFSAVIPKGMNRIGDCAFDGCSNLVSVVIPEGVKKIENGAFGMCTSLTSIELPDGVTEIDNFAFCGCAKLTSIVIPDGVKKIGDSSFANCTSLTSIVLPDSITSIDSCAFEGCTGLTSIEIPSGVTFIDHSVFSGCSGLTSVTIPDGVTEIGASAFCNCTGLTSIKIPDSVTKIWQEAFAGCTNLKQIQASKKHKMMILAQILESSPETDVSVVEQSLSGMSLEERLDRLADLKYFTLDSDSMDDEDAEHGCTVEMSYTGEWEIWLTDCSGSDHRACCVKARTEEYLTFVGENKYELSGTGETMEEALGELEKRVEILRKNKSFKVLFTWDD